VYRKTKDKEPQKIRAEWVALVLVEMAFISTPSPDEEILLKNAYENYTGIRVAIHRGIRNVVCSYFGLNQCPLPGIYP
jgi:N-acetylmuramoyl-L-alanine amidase